MLPEISQPHRWPCLPLPHRVVLHYHFPNPAGAVGSLKEAIVLHVLQLLSVKVSLCKVQQQSNLNVGGIRNVAKEIIYYEHEVRLALRRQLSSGNLHIFLQQSNRSIGEEFPAEVGYCL